MSSSETPGDGGVPWLRPSAEGAVLTLHVQPGAKRTEVAGVHGEALKIRLAAPPMDGKANEALVAFLAGRLGVPRGRVVIVAGQTARAKRLRVEGVAPEAIRRALGGGA
ncbi:MAG: YggU family protein [Rhodocyclaceae bacterium]|nr:YggU family protein [Rhodocyclaceae bacterium]